MNVYTCTRFKGHYPVGAAAVVVATDTVHGAELLAEHLVAEGLTQWVDPAWLVLLCGAAEGTGAGVVVLNDGEY